MKTLIYAATGLLCASVLVAEPIDSKVIHNYNQFGVGYNYVDGDDIDGHGVVGSASVDLNNGVTPDPPAMQIKCLFGS